MARFKNCSLPAQILQVVKFAPNTASVLNSHNKCEGGDFTFFWQEVFLRRRPATKLAGLELWHHTISSAHYVLISQLSEDVGHSCCSLPKNSVTQSLHTQRMTSSTQSPTQNMLGHAWPSHRFYLHDASKGPNVGLCAMALPVEYLRGQVVGGSTDGSKRDTHTHTQEICWITFIHSNQCRCHPDGGQAKLFSRSGIPRQRVKPAVKLGFQHCLQLPLANRFRWAIEKGCMIAHVA